jgi:Rod binding domain-containing protein
MSAPIARSAPSLASLNESDRNSYVRPERRIQEIDRSKVDPSLLKAAEGMEAMFIDYMMQVMRQSVPENGFGLDSSASKIYQGLLDTEYAQMAAKQGGVGLAEQIIAYLSEQRYNQEGRTSRPEAAGARAFQGKGYEKARSEIKQGSSQ